MEQQKKKKPYRNTWVILMAYLSMIKTLQLVKQSNKADCEALIYLFKTLAWHNTSEVWNRIL